MAEFSGTRIRETPSVKFSVIIPAFNAEPYIAQAIESRLSQTYPAHEIVVVDDGSTDSTAAIAETFPSPVQVIRLPVFRKVIRAQSGRRGIHWRLDCSPRC